MRPAGAAALTALVTAVGLGSPALAPAAQRTASGLHDARYCEILELKGSLPDAHVTVWNTIGLNDCPAARWNAFDAGSLAKELGDGFVVLNGPRHWLIDSATGRSGGVRSFHGLRMRRVASIPIRSAADLVQTPYTDRTIRRTNTWRWKRGRRVFELVAPGGDTYVMQSYAQIKDPTLTIGKLRALGKRLEPPPGWRFRSRRLKRALVLTAKGSTTIIQDELQDTYQLATTTHRGRRARHRVHMTGRTRSVPPASPAPGAVEDHGTVTAAPFGSGRIVLVGALKDGRLTATFRLVFRHGSITGTVLLPYTISAGHIRFTGVGHFTGGTGAYRGISSGDLQIRDHNTLDGQSGTLSVKGFATY